MEAFIPVGILIVLTLILCGSIYTLTTLAGPKVPTPAKTSTYECGVTPESAARAPFTMKYYLIAVLFLLFDIEVAFFLPWALIYRESLRVDGTLLIAMLVFMFFLVLALLYVFKKDYLGLNND